MVSKKSKNNNNNGTTAAPQNSSYIVIGKQHNNSSTGSTATVTANGDQAQPNGSMEKPKKEKKPDAAPKSMAEALLLYTSKNSNSDDNVTAVKEASGAFYGAFYGTSHFCLCLGRRERRREGP